MVRWPRVVLLMPVLLVAADHLHLDGETQKKIFPLYAPIYMNALAFLAASHSATTLSRQGAVYRKT